MRFIQPLLLTFFLLIASVQATATNMIGIAAVVDGKEITERELQNALNSYMIQRGMNVGAIRKPDNFNELRDKILSVLIKQELLWQAAKKDNTIASSDEVDQAMTGFRAQFESDVAFEVKLQEGGYTQASFHNELERRLSVEKWLKIKVTNGIKIDDAEVSQFYEENQSKFASPDQVRARHILIQIQSDSSDAEREAARQLLTELRQRIVDGEDFAALAKTHSQDSSASKGGDLGFFGPGIMVKPFEEAAFGLSPGEVSEIVETRFGLHLIQPVERKPSGYYPLSVADKQIRDYLYKQKHQASIDQAVDRLRQSAQVEISN